MNSSACLINSNKKSERNSSFELLRIILIFMILVEHGNMWFLVGKCETEIQRFAQCLIESICIGSVNAFVLISGWFGINNGIKKIGNLIFMVLFCTVPLLIVTFSLNWVSAYQVLSLDGIYQYVFGGNSYWFVIDYIFLLVIAPILNNGIERIKKHKFRNILIFGYAIIFIYDFVFRTSVLGSEGGYSVLWFAYLYLSARYMRLYGLKWLDKLCVPFLITCIIVQTVLFYYGLIGMRYTNPLILVESICLIYLFKRYSFQSGIINTIAGSVLLAYLIHMQPLFSEDIRIFMSNQFAVHGYWVYMLEVVALSLGCIVIAVFLNQIQKYLYLKLRECLSL